MKKYLFLIQSHNEKAYENMYYAHNENEAIKMFYSQYSSSFLIDGIVKVFPFYKEKHN